MEMARVSARNSRVGGRQRRTLGLDLLPVPVGGDDGGAAHALRGELLVHGGLHGARRRDLEEVDAGDEEAPVEAHVPGVGG